MGFVEIKKSVNTDLNVPLNHLVYLNDYKTFGETSYVFRNKKLLHELYEDGLLCIHDSDICGEAMDYVIQKNQKVGAYLAGAYDIKQTDTLNSLKTMNAVLNSATAMNAVAKGTSNWTTAVKKNFFTAINNSPERIKSVYSILKNTTYFTRKDSNWQDGVSGLNSYGKVSYAANGLIACFLGSYGGNNNSTTNLFIDGEQVASKASSSSPTSVSESNVNAIACPTATFTETGDGQAAIEVYIAV